MKHVSYLKTLIFPTAIFSPAYNLALCFPDFNNKQRVRNGDNIHYGPYLTKIVLLHPHFSTGICMCTLE